MFKSCLTLVVLLILAVVAFRMYKKSQEPVSTEIQGAYSPDYITSIMSSVDPYVNQRPNIQRVNLDGSVLDLIYSEDQSIEKFREDASIIAEVFSRRKQELTSDSEVTVRCIYNNLIRVEASAENGRVLSIQQI